MWLVSNTAAGWQFVDPCWAAGAIEWRVGINAAASVAGAGETHTGSDQLFLPDVRYHKRLAEQFWLMEPLRAIADHCPEDEAWQLLVCSLSVTSVLLAYWYLIHLVLWNGQDEPQSVINYQRAVYRTPAFFDKDLTLQSHPDDGTIMCSDRFDVTIGHSPLLRGCFCCVLHAYSDRANRRIGTHSAKYPLARGATIVRSGMDMTTFHLRFPMKGEYELKMYCATDRASAADKLVGERPWATAFDLVCCYRFFAHGAGVPEPERYPWAAVGVSLFEPDQRCLHSNVMQKFRLKAHKHGPTIKHMFLQFMGQKYPLAPFLASDDEGDHEGHGWTADIVFPEGSHGMAYIIAERALTAFHDQDTDHYAQLDVLAEFEIVVPGAKKKAPQSTIAPAPAPQPKPAPAPEPAPEPVPEPEPAPEPEPELVPEPVPEPEPEEPIPDLPEPVMPDPIVIEPVPLRKEHCRACSKEVDLTDAIFDGKSWWHIPCMHDDPELTCGVCGGAVDPDNDIKYRGTWVHKHCFDTKCPVPHCMNAPGHGPGMFGRHCLDHQPELNETKTFWLLAIDPPPEPEPEPEPRRPKKKVSVSHSPVSTLQLFILTRFARARLWRLWPTPLLDQRCLCDRAFVSDTMHWYCNLFCHVLICLEMKLQMQAAIVHKKIPDGLIHIRTTAGAVSRGREKVVHQDITHYKFWLNHRCRICGLLWPLCRHARSGGPLAKEEYTATRGYFDVDRNSRTLQRGLARASERLLVTDAQRTAKQYTPEYDKWLEDVRLKVSKQPNRLMTAEPVTTLRTAGAAARKKRAVTEAARTYTGPVDGRPHPWNMPPHQRNDIVEVTTAARNHPWDSRVQVPIRKSVQTYLNRVGLGAWYSTFEEHLPTRIKSVELMRATTAADLRQMGKRIGTGRARSLASLMGVKENADESKRYEHLSRAANTAHQQLGMLTLAMQQAKSYEVDAAKSAVDTARRAHRIAEKERQDCLQRMDNVTIKQVLQALKREPTDQELLRVPAWTAPVEQVETTQVEQYVIEFVTSEGSDGPTADVYCQVMGDESTSKTIRCANIAWSHFGSGSGSPFRFSEDTHLGDVETIVVQHSPTVAGAAWSLNGIVVTCERTKRRWSATADDAKFDDETPSRTFQVASVPDGTRPLPLVHSVEEDAGPMVGYAVHLRVRVVSELESEIPLSVVVRGELAEHTVLVEVCDSGNNLEAIHAETTFECADLGTFKAIDVGDWAGMCGGDTAPVQVYLEHADLERSDANHNQTSARTRCYCHQWLPRRETLSLCVEDKDSRVISKVQGSEEATPRAWVLRLVTGDDRVARSMHTPKWKREPPTVTIVLSCDGVAVDFALVGLKYTPYVGEQFVCLVVPASFDLDRTILSICADDRRPGGLSLPFDWNLSQIQILGAEGGTEKKMQIWHAECGFTLSCHNSTSKRVVRPTQVGDIACYSGRVTVHAGRSGMPAAPVVQFAMGATDNRVSLFAAQVPGYAVVDGCQLTALPEWLPQQLDTKHLEKQLKVGIQSHCATGVLLDTIEVAYNGKVMPYRLSRELLRSDGMRAVSVVRLANNAAVSAESSAESGELAAASQAAMPDTKVKGSLAPTPHKVFLRFSKSRMVQSVSCELGFRCETEEGSDMIWSQRIEMSRKAGYFAAHGEYEFPIVLSDPELLERPERILTAVRVFVAADEWIVECVGVVEVQSGEAFAAVFAPTADEAAQKRVSHGGAEDEEKAADVRQQRSNVREKAMAVEVSRAEAALVKSEESRAETAQINARRLHSQIEKEVAELEAELQEKKDEAARSRARWRASASLAKARKKRSRSPDPWEKAKDMVDALAAAVAPAHGALPTESATARKTVVSGAADFAEMSEQEKMEARARARWRLARSIDSELAFAARPARPWEDNDEVAAAEDELSMVTLPEKERWKLAEQAAADRMRGMRDYSGQRKAFGRPWVDCAKEILTEWCVTVGGTLAESMSGRADHEIKATKTDVLRLLAALKEHKGVEVTWEEVADEVSAEQLLVIIAQQINPDDVDRYIRFVLTPLAELQRHGWYEPPALARLANLRLAEATASLEAAGKLTVEKAAEHKASANAVVFAEHAQLGAEAELRASVARFDASGGFLHREAPLTSQGKVESEIQRQQRRPARVEELAASAELSWWQSHRNKPLKPWQKSVEYPPTAENPDGRVELLPWDKTMLRSKPGLAIEKKRRDLEVLAARDDELSKRGLYFDRERGIYTTQKGASP
jgi:hypothetical protein